MLTNMFLRAANSGSEWVLWILVILSFVSIAFIADRIIYFQRHKIDGESLATQLGEMLTAGNLRGAYALVANSQALECLVVAAGLTSLRMGAHPCSESMASVKAREKGTVDARLAALGTIGSNAPFIGLLGTVLGIIKAANDIASSGGADKAMAGVFEALVATAVGLFVAIPAVVAYNIFQRKVKTTMANVDSLAHLVLAHAKEGKGSGHGQPGGQAGGQPAQQPAKV